MKYRVCIGYRFFVFEDFTYAMAFAHMAKSTYVGEDTIDISIVLENNEPDGKKEEA